MGGPSPERIVKDITDAANNIKDIGRLDNPGNVLGDIRAGFNRGVRDVVGGAGQILRGDIDKGAQTLIKGYVGASTGGASELLAPTSSSVEQATDKAVNQAEADKAAVVTYEANTRKEKIRLRLDQEIKQRMRTPGRAATLLTPTLIPNEARSQTLLSGLGGS